MTLQNRSPHSLQFPEMNCEIRFSAKGSAPLPPLLFPVVHDHDRILSPLSPIPRRSASLFTQPQPPSIWRLFVGEVSRQTNRRHHTNPAQAKAAQPAAARQQGRHVEARYHEAGEWQVHPNAGKASTGNGSARHGTRRSVSWSEPPIAKATCSGEAGQ